MLVFLFFGVDSGQIGGGTLMGINNISAKHGLRMIVGGFYSLLFLMACLLLLLSRAHGHCAP